MADSAILPLALPGIILAAEQRCGNVCGPIGLFQIELRHPFRKRGPIVINLFARTLILLPLLAVQAAFAQVTVDVSKITCEQFIVMPKADSIAIWLSGYYHGDKHVSTLDVNQFEENARNFRAACRLPDNFKKPIMQLIESTLAK